MKYLATAITTAAIVFALSSPAAAYWNCDGLITSNNSCIGSESNVDSYRNHEPFYTDEDSGNRQLGDSIRPHRLTARQKANIERTKRRLLKEIPH
jgi:hypothetical protein